MNQNLDIKKGDTIAIRAMGIVVRGTVYSAQNYGNVGWNPGDDWYIEVTPANVPGGYSYWKQGQDGGHIVEHNGIAVDGGTSGK